MVPRPKRIEPTHDWQQLELRLRLAGQRAYELIRPVVLFGHSLAERAAETGAAERPLYRQVTRFAQLGMASFAPPWLKVLRLRDYAPRRLPAPNLSTQLSLFPGDPGDCRALAAPAASAGPTARRR